MTIETAVCIVGAGPTGLGLALDLGRRGVETALLERRPRTDDRPPTANHVGVRAMEVLRRWGVAERVCKEGFDPQHGDDRVFVTSVGGREIFRIRRPANGVDLALEHTPEREAWCPKHDFDRFLEEGASKRRSVDLRYGTEVLDLEPVAEGVRVRARDSEGHPLEVRAHWLVGCDGSRSTVRSLACIPLLVDLELPVTLLSVDFHSPALARALPAGWTQCTLLDTGAMIVAIDPVDRFRIHVPAELGAEIAPAEAHAWLDRIAGRPIRAEIRSVLPWRLTSSLASEYRRGRVLLAGDAAKRVTPYGGLGANYGLVDVATLGWMLEALECGWGASGLLDGYEVERRSAARRLLEYQGVDLDAEPPTMTTRLGLPELPAGLEEEGPAGEAARALAARRLAEHNAGHFDNPGVDLDQRADDSPIVASDGSPAPPWDPRRYVETSRPGHRAPHRWLPGGISTLDLYDRGFTLWRLGGDAPSTERLEDAARSRGVPMRVVSSSDPAVVAAYERALVLVRPDGITAWRGDALPDEPTTLLDLVRGAAPPSP